MNDDLISRQAAIDALEELKELDYEFYIRTGYSHLMEDDWDFVIKRYKEAIKETPCAHQKQGHWIGRASHPLLSAASNVWVCSECDDLVETAHYAYRCYYKYCPYCGAKMEG